MPPRLFTATVFSNLLDIQHDRADELYLILVQYFLEK
jgi:hypothetical protein